MDRRSLFASMMGFAGIGPALCAPKGGGDPRGRPSLAVDPEGPQQWRIRSWEWRRGAWRPAIGHAVASASGIELRGRIAPADRDEVRARLTSGTMT